MKTELERIASLEVQTGVQEALIQELRVEFKEVRGLIEGINTKLATLTHEQAVVSVRIAETHAVATKVSSVVDGIRKDDDNQAYATRIGFKVIAASAALGSGFLMLYQNRYGIVEFFKKVFG